MDRCTECGFEYDLGDAPSAGRTIVGDVSQLPAILCDTPGDPARRVRPETWSPLENSGHVRDVLLVHRLERSLGWVAVHTLHEVRHHLLDVRRQLG